MRYNITHTTQVFILMVYNPKQRSLLSIQENNEQLLNNFRETG